MEIIKKVINIKILSGSTISIPVFLTQKTFNIGLVTDYATDTTLSSPVTVNLSGVTNDKLKDIRSFDYNNEYIVGVNGVTAVSDTQIDYKIADISYQTKRSDLSTTFSFQTTRQDYVNNNFISTDASLKLIDKVQIKDLVDIERPNISIIESFSKFRQITSVQEIENFNNGFYKINNQTI